MYSPLTLSPGSAGEACQLSVYDHSTINASLSLALEVVFRFSNDNIEGLEAGLNTQCTSRN